MELHEAKQLIPLYVANTLSSAERAEVDEALKASKELNDELAFWRKAQLAAHAHAEYARKEHLSSEQIVDFAERAVTDPKLLYEVVDRSQIEAHLQTCKECAEEYDMIMKTIPEREQAWQAKPTIFEMVQRLVGSLKPLYVIPVAVMLIAGIIVWRSFDTKNNTPGMASNESSVSENTLRLVLPFQPQMRGRDEESLPTVAVNTSVKWLHVIACLPHDSLIATTYTATLSTPEGKTITLRETFSKVVSQLMDSLKLSLEAELLQVEGEYTLNIAEVPSSLPPGASPFPSEPYRFRVTHTAGK